MRFRYVRGARSARLLLFVLVCVFVAGFVSSANAATSGRTERVSVSSIGEQGNSASGGESAFLSMSNDGRYAAFASAAGNLVPEDTNNNWDIFVRDRVAGTTERVNVTNAGGQANGYSFDAAMSADGRFVAFSSDANNLVEGDSNNSTDVFVRDRVAGTTERVSVSGSGGQANSWCGNARISADGRYVVFVSGANNFVEGDTNGFFDIFVHDRSTGTTERVNVSSAGVQANNSSFNAAISADGRYIAFSSAAGNLVAGDVNGTSDIFVRDRLVGTTERIGKNPNGWSDNPSISSDGRLVAFTSAANNLVAGDTNSKTDVFVCDRSVGSIERANITKTGTQANNSSFGTAISGDGQYVAFSSPANNLVAGDTNGATDIFVRDRSTGEIERVDVSCAGDQGNGWCGSICVSSNGRFVGFSSFANNLVPSDTNNAWDVFIHDRCNDATPPVTVAALDGAVGENGWFTSDVTVLFTATDNGGGSGVARTEYSFDGTNWTIFSGPVVLSSEGQSVVFYRSVDNAGNYEVVRQLVVNLDKTPPVVSMLSPLDGAQYLLGQAIPVDWTATDTISGVATDAVLGIVNNTGAIAMGMTTGRPAVGPQSFTVRAVDYAGNVTEKTVRYYIAYDFSGILRPIDAGGASVFNLGRDVPVKFALKDGDGNPVADATARLYLSTIGENGPGEEIAAVSASRAAKDNLFRYDADCEGYIFNLRTKGLSTGNWRLRIELSDGTSKYVDIALR